MQDNRFFWVRVSVLYRQTARTTKKNLFWFLGQKMNGWPLTQTNPRPDKERKQNGWNKSEIANERARSLFFSLFPVSFSFPPTSGVPSFRRRMVGLPRYMLEQCHCCCLCHWEERKNGHGSLTQGLFLSAVLASVRCKTRVTLPPSYLFSSFFYFSSAHHFVSHPWFLLLIFYGPMSSSFLSLIFPRSLARPSFLVLQGEKRENVN